MISAVYFFNSRGETVIFRHYRDDVSRTEAESYRLEILNVKDSGTPARIIGTTLFCSIKVANVFVVACTKKNLNAALVMSFLYQTVEVFKSYFGGKFNEDALRNNFVLIYELLDEIMDFGFPQTTASEVLKELILQKGADVDKALSNKSVTTQVTGAVSWRREGIKYRKNEVFIDVIESVNLLMSATGTCLRTDVAGSVMVKCFLSGMPECKFGLNDKLGLDKESKNPAKRNKGGTGGIEIDDMKFHHCVRLSKFDTDRTITFIPPDGDFELMSYRITENINNPFKIFPVLKIHGRTRIEANVKLRASFSAKLFALNVIVKIPCPKNTARAQTTCNAGRAKYESEHDAVVWKIKKFPGDMEYTLSTEIELVATTTEKRAWAPPPISMDFQVPMFTASGLHVRFLKVVERSNYQTTKWVRYITKGGSYQHRINA